MLASTLDEYSRLLSPPFFWHSAVQSTDIAPLHIYPCICSVDPCLRVLWMSTHGCFAPPFPPSLFFPIDATRWWILGARCHHRRILLHGGHRRLGVVRRSQAGGLASLIVDVCASLLKASLFNLCLYSDIVASADSCVSSLYSSPRGPWLVI